MKAGDKIKVPYFIMGHLVDWEERTLEEFRFCLGFFESERHRECEIFTPLCELYEPHPDAEEKYMAHMGSYYSSYVPMWAEIPN